MSRSRLFFLALIFALACGYVATLKRGQDENNKSAVPVQNEAEEGLTELDKELDWYNKDDERFFAPGEILIVFKRGVPQEQIDQFVRQHELAFVEGMPTLESGLYKILDGTPVMRLCRDLENDPVVESSCPNGRLSPMK